MKNNIYNLNLQEIEEYLKDKSIAKFKAKQIWNWLYINLVKDFDEMKNVDKKTKEILSESFYIPNYKIESLQKAKDGTQKVLLKLNDNNLIETVLMKQKYGYSVCVTTQLGCAVGCSFCASGLLGLKRNLTSGEIVSQVIFWQRELSDIDKRVSQVVVMGIGEPFNNYDELIKFIDLINDEKSFNIGARHITISTSGIVPGIKKITKYQKQVNLAISLHAPNDELRSKIMKINDVYGISDLLDEVRNYQKETNRRVTFEYIMLRGLNDSVEEANELADLIKDINHHVNLIPYNNVDENEYYASDRKNIEAFCQVLLKKKINVTIRKEMGSDIDGACGQLRHKAEKV